MKIKLLSVLLSVIALVFEGCAEKTEPVREVLQYEAVKEIVQTEDDVLYVLNFWATWCAPCVEEIPDFMNVNQKFKDEEKFKMILISLDNVREFDTSVKNFLLKNNISTDVYLLDDNKRMNEWIPAFDSLWSGSIPATLIYRNAEKLHFTEGQLTEEELTGLINGFL
jgi:thiol-disulfide isomerase/thioredoxin